MSQKQYTKKQIVEAIVYWQKQLDEARHDGIWLPKHPTHRNPTDKPTIYYLGVDDSDDFRGYGSYIMVNGNLTPSASSSDFKLARVTTQKSTLKSMISSAIAKYGKTKHIFVFKEEYSYGTQTHKRHARPSVVDIWYPSGQYWRYGLAVVDGSTVNESAKSYNNANALSIKCYANADFNGKYIKRDVESEMHEIGIENVDSQEWMSYVLGHTFFGSDGWTDDIESIVLDPRVKRVDILVGDDLVSIEKNA